MLKNAADSIRLIVLGIVVAVPLFVLGFVPVIGQTVVPVVDVVVGGWLLAVELTGVPYRTAADSVSRTAAPCCAPTVPWRSASACPSS